MIAAKSKPRIMLDIMRERGEVSIADIATATNSHAKTVGKFFTKLVNNGAATVRLEKTKKLYRLVPGADPKAVKLRAARGSVSAAMRDALRREKLTASELAAKIGTAPNTVNVLLRRDFIQGLVKREKLFGHSRPFVYFID